MIGRIGSRCARHSLYGSSPVRPEKGLEYLVMLFLQFSDISGVIMVTHYFSGRSHTLQERQQTFTDIHYLQGWIHNHNGWEWFPEKCQCHNNISQTITAAFTLPAKVAEPCSRRVTGSCPPSPTPTTMEGHKRWQRSCHGTVINFFLFFYTL